MATQNNSIRQLDLTLYPSVNSHSDLNLKMVADPRTNPRIQVLPQTADTNERIQKFY